MCFSFYVYCYSPLNILIHVLLRINGFQRRQSTYHLMSYAKALKKARCESVERTICKRRPFFAGGVQRSN